MKSVMKESGINKNILTMMFGVLFIGGAAAIFGIVRATKHSEHQAGFLLEEPDGNIFVCGAHA